MREITKQESLEIIHRAMSGPIDFPVEADDPRFPDQLLPWKDLLDNTPVTTEDVYKSIVTATKSLDPDRFVGYVSQTDLSAHIDANDTETVSSFSTFLVENLVIKEL